MTDTYSDFFAGKRPWSKIKDSILGSYLPPYLKKVSKLNKTIFIIDGFAGPGKFEDGSIGSPLMICEIAKEHLGNNFKAILVNKEKKYHNQLTNSVKDFIDAGCVHTINGTAEDLLLKLKNTLRDESILVYLDQFGISGFKFESLLPYLSRQQKYSTELVLNISVPVIHRLSAKNHGITQDKSIINRRNVLTEVFGGGYWMNHLFNDNLDANEQIEKLMYDYKKLLKNYLSYVGYCPVYERGERSKLKYYIFFASRHPDAALLLNDIMFRAYWSHIWDCTFKGTLFEQHEQSINLPCNYYEELKSQIVKNF